MPEPILTPATPLTVTAPALDTSAFEAAITAAITARDVTPVAPAALAPTPSSAPPVSPAPGVAASPPSAPLAAPPAATPEAGDDLSTDTTPDTRRVPDPTSATKKASQWGELKATRDAAMERAERLQKQLDAITRGEELPPDLARLKKEHAELDTLLKAVALERHPSFATQYESRKKQTLDIVRATVGDKAESIVGILQMPPSPVRRRMLNDALADADPMQLAVVGNAFVDLDRLSAERDAALARSGDVWKEHEQRQRDSVQAAQAARSRHLDTALEKWQKSGLDIFSPKDGDTAHNATVQQRVELARAVFNGSVDPDEAARHVMWGAAAPALLEQLNVTRKELDTLRGEMTKLRSAQPGDGGTPAPTNGAALESMTPEERMTIQLKAAMGM